MQETEGICLELFEGFVPHSFSAVFGGYIHADGCSAVTWIKVKEINATNGKTALRAQRRKTALLQDRFAQRLNNQTELTVFVDIAGSRGYIIPQILLRERIMVCPIRPDRRIVLPLIEEREI
jgi:hypothetical protein